VTTVREIEIRRAEERDATDVGVLTERVYREGGWTSEHYAAVLRDARTRIAQAVVFVATRDGAVVGSVALAPPGTPFVNVAGADEAEVRMLAVAPDARGRGIADALVARCEQQARAAGLAGVVLSTEATMHAAHRLYRRRGYRRQPERDWAGTRTTYLVYRVDLAATGPGTNSGST
jgi:ribosomal protein S18 acetylase RimI-like enzyme